MSAWFSIFFYALYAFLPQVRKVVKKETFFLAFPLNLVEANGLFASEVNLHHLFGNYSSLMHSSAKKLSSMAISTSTQSLCRDSSFANKYSQLIGF